MNVRGARRWLFWFVILAATSAMMLVVRERLDKAHVALAFLLVVLMGSAAEGRVVGIALASAAFVAFNWFFLAPYNTLIIADPLDWLVLFAFLATGIVAAQLLERQRRATASAERRASEIDRLATLGAETLNAPRAEDALHAIASVIREAVLTDECEIYQWDAAAGLELAGSSPALTRAPRDAALLAYTVENAAPAAERADGTLTLLDDALTQVVDDATRPALTALRTLGIPLSVRGRVVGALRLSSAQPFDIGNDQRRVLGALSYYAALGVERVRLATAEGEAESLRRADRLKDALLASVSHDLRTPLTAIKGIAHEVWTGGDPVRAQVIEEEADRLNAMVSDLLVLSQLNAGVLRLSPQLNAADDVVGAAVERVEQLLGRERIAANIANDGGILIGTFDFTHTLRILTNLLENAIKYSPEGAPVSLDVTRTGERLRFVVKDTGHGVPAGDEQRIFEPFYRGSHVPDGVRGTGLGLSIARELAEAQRGTLAYERMGAGGSQFVLELPSAELPVG